MINIGDHDWTTGAETDNFRMGVSQVKMYPGYQQGGQLNNDVALLKLSHPLNFPALPLVRPICLPPTSSNMYENQPAMVAGWGKTGSSSSISTVLLETPLTVWTQVIEYQKFNLDVLLQ